MSDTGATTESRTAALAMFEGHVPCFFSLADPPCTDLALWLAWFVHEENSPRAAGCEASPWPVCEAHKKMVAMATHPFWRTWHRMPPTLCDQCETPLRLERFDPL